MATPWPQHNRPRKDLAPSSASSLSLSLSPIPSSSSSISLHFQFLPRLPYEIRVPFIIFESCFHGFVDASGRLNGRLPIIRSPGPVFPIFHTPARESSRPRSCHDVRSRNRALLVTTERPLLVSLRFPITGVRIQFLQPQAICRGRAFLPLLIYFFLPLLPCDRLRRASSRSSRVVLRMHIVILIQMP